MSTRARNHFSSTLIDGAKRTNNAPEAHKAKVTIRQSVLDAIGAENARVLDAFCGAGEMYRGVWRQAASYVGIDENWYRDERRCYAADNRRVMRAIDLTPFNVVDCDSWGSPWECVTIFAARRPIQQGETWGLVLTEGSGLRLKMGWIPDALALMSKLKRHMPGVARNHEEIIDRAISELCRRTNSRVVKQWRARGRAASSLWYIGLVLQGLEDQHSSSTRASKQVPA